MKREIIRAERGWRECRERELRAWRRETTVALACLAGLWVGALVLAWVWL